MVEVIIGSAEGSSRWRRFMTRAIWNRWNGIDKGVVRGGWRGVKTTTESSLPRPIPPSHPIPTPHPVSAPPVPLVYHELPNQGCVLGLQLLLVTPPTLSLQSPCSEHMQTCVGEGEGRTGDRISVRRRGRMEQKSGSIQPRTRDL